MFILTRRRGLATSLERVNASFGVATAHTTHILIPHLSDLNQTVTSISLISPNSCNYYYYLIEKRNKLLMKRKA